MEEAAILKGLRDQLLKGGTYVELCGRKGAPTTNNDDSQWSEDSDLPKYGNIRTINVLPGIFKVYEKVMYNRLIDFLEKEKNLIRKTIWFPKKHSTYMALMLLMDQLINSLENGQYIIGLFLDFSKAFDTVDHSILLSKLHHYGIRGVANIWFQSYLSNRKQFVTYNNTKSSMCGYRQ